MADKAQIEQMTAYISKCPVCTVATASPDGDPSASTVYFNSVGVDIYFNTARDSQKVRHITANPRVAVTMQALPDVKTDRQITGIQYYGKAQILADNEIADVPKAVMARHRAFNSTGQGNAVIVKVTPTRIFYVDYSRGFRHRDALQF